MLSFSPFRSNLRSNEGNKGKGFKDRKWDKKIYFLILNMTKLNLPQFS